MTRAARVGALVLVLAGALPVRAEPMARGAGAGRNAPQERSVSSDDETAAPLAEPENLERLIFTRKGPSGTDERVQLGADQVKRMLSEREGYVKLRREEAIEELLSFVTQEPENAPEMPDALLRLAELRWEQARVRYLQDYQAWQSVPKNVRSEKPPAADIHVPLALYNRILTRHKSFDRYDLVLYMKAYALMEATRMSDALGEYKRIIDAFPKSRFIPDAHMAFAEWYFTGSYDYENALREYEAVLRYPQSELSDIALFKSAWCLWKLGKVTEAATRFREVLDLSGKLATASDERKHRLLELQDEAL